MSQMKRVRPSAKTSRTRMTEAVRLKPRPSVQEKMRKRQRRRDLIGSLRPRAADAAVFCVVAAIAVAILVGGAR